MEVGQIVAELDAEIARLNEVRNLLAGHNTTAARGGGGGGVPSPFRQKVGRKKRRHTMSAEGRARIAAAQKARWAKQKKAAK